MWDNLPGNGVDEDIQINQILDWGLEEIQMNNLTKYNNQNDINPSIQQTYDYSSIIRANNPTFHTNSPNCNILESTKKVLKQSNNVHTLPPSSNNTIKSSKEYQSQPKNKTKFSVNTNKSTSAKSNSNYQFKYEQWRKVLDQKKNEWVQEKIKKTELDKKIQSIIKKDKKYDSVDQENKDWIEQNERLFTKITQSEEIRTEQNNIINSLQYEYQRLKQYFKDNDNTIISPTGENTTSEGKMIKKKKVGKCPNKKNFKKLKGK